MPETQEISEKPESMGKIAARETFDWVECVIMALVAVIILLTFVGRGTNVEGSSMLPTLEDGQFLVLDRLFYKLEINDVIVVYADKLRNEQNEYGKPIVKRVIGLPGDVIDIDFDKGIVYRNGEALPLSDNGLAITEDGHLINDYTHNHIDMNGPVTVPEGSVFVMGDNRNASLDSRSDEVGTVDTRYIIGQVAFRVTPLSAFGAVK